MEQTINMARLFLDGIFDKTSNSPSTITISVPVATGTSFISSGVLLRGLIVGDPTWTASNKWGPIINDFSSLQDWASLVGSNNQFSWISASTMCWKGTSPLAINVDFYLINYAKGLNLKSKLSTLVKLAAIAKSENNSDFRVQVHGGYAPDILTGNKSFFTSEVGIRELISDDTAMSDLNAEVANMFEGKTAKGSLSIQFGHKSKISNLLLTKINVTESTVEVADINGGNIQPLYYRVSAQFTGVQPLVTTEVDDIFNTTSGAPQASTATDDAANNGGTSTLEYRQTPLRPIQ
jgi:hypothetical protein